MVLSRTKIILILFKPHQKLTMKIIPLLKKSSHKNLLNSLTNVLMLVYFLFNKLHLDKDQVTILFIWKDKLVLTVGLPVTFLEIAHIVHMFPTIHKVDITCQGGDLPQEILWGHVQAMVIGMLKRPKIILSRTNRSCLTRDLIWEIVQSNQDR